EAPEPRREGIRAAVVRDAQRALEGDRQLPELEAGPASNRDLVAHGRAPFAEIDRRAARASRQRPGARESALEALRDHERADFLRARTAPRSSILVRTRGRSLRLRYAPSPARAARRAPRGGHAARARAHGRGVRALPRDDPRRDARRGSEPGGLRAGVRRA